MKKWLNVEFESCCNETEQFKSFNKDFKKYIKKNIPEGYNVISWNKGHFYISAMILRPDAQIVYFSISDVRHFRNSWYNNILYRTAKHDKDWIGGRNNYSTLDNLFKNINDLPKGG
jgi:hypothetical protein